MQIKPPTCRGHLILGITLALVTLAGCQPSHGADLLLPPQGTAPAVPPPALLAPAPIAPAPALFPFGFDWPILRGPRPYFDPLDLVPRPVFGVTPGWAATTPVEADSLPLPNPRRHRLGARGYPRAHHGEAVDFPPFTRNPPPRPLPR